MLEFKWILVLAFLGYIVSVLGDEADDQLLTCKNRAVEPATDQRGVPVPSLTATQTAGPRGPVVLQDFNYIDHVAHFNRERIPERVVHAKGGGAFGHFEVTHNISQYTRALVFDRVGKQTPILVRFSSTMPQSGGSDTIRDGRGFSLKFYTDDGNWDLVGNNLPVFPIRDPMLFPNFIHSRKRNPATHLDDMNAFWDFNSLRPETTHHAMYFFSDLGIPDGFRFQNGFGVHTFKLVNAQNVAVYVKFNYHSNQGIKWLNSDEAITLGGMDPDRSLRDLYNAIESKNFPSWNFSIQVMTFEQAEKYRYNPFDVTKLWPLQDFPEIPVGKLVLNRNPTDYFTEIEQAAFAPSAFVPGIEPSPDRLLHGRIFAYMDAQRHRLGPNFLQLPVNRPKVKVTTYQRDGAMCMDDNGAGAPNYFPNSFGGSVVDKTRAHETGYPLSSGDVVRVDVGEEDNYSQADMFWKTDLDGPGRERLVNNIAASLVTATETIQNRAMSKMFDPINSEIGPLVRKAVMNLKDKNKTKAK